jgi:hypothetical protein
MHEANLIKLLEHIDIKAQAGLCQMTHAGARCFLQDIRYIVKEALLREGETQWMKSDSGQNASGQT